MLPFGGTVKSNKKIRHIACRQEKVQAGFLLMLEILL
jgi:hypothetical protein